MTQEKKKPADLEWPKPPKPELLQTFIYSPFTRLNLNPDEANQLYNSHSEREKYRAAGTTVESHLEIGW